jgi:glutamate--cysteine ligase
MSEAEELLKHLQYMDYSQLRYDVPRYGLKTEIKNKTVLDYAKGVIEIAEKSLKNMQTGESLFIMPVKDYVTKGMSPADEIIKKWNGPWNKNIKKMINYLTQ